MGIHCHCNYVYFVAYFVVGEGLSTLPKSSLCEDIGRVTRLPAPERSDGGQEKPAPTVRNVFVPSCKPD